MKPLPFIIGLFLVAVIVYILRTRSKIPEVQPDTDTSRPSPSALPIKSKINDKLAIIKNVSYSDLKDVLKGFCNMYNKKNYQAQPRLIKLSEREFAITFPYDVDFEIYCYFINYLKYPMGLTWAPDVSAWTTTKNSDTWITEKSANKKVMLFIPFDDTEHDNVYMTTYDNIEYKLGFAVGEEKQLLGAPKRRYATPSIEISELTNKEFEDFR